MPQFLRRPYEGQTMRPITYTATAADAAQGFTQAIPVDYMRVNGQYGFHYTNAAGQQGTGNVQATLDDVFNLPYASLAWININLAAGGWGWINLAITGVRLLNPVAGDVLRIVAQGGAPGV